MDLRVLRALLAPELRIAPGRALMARVVSADGSGRGSLSIAGFLLEAELPKHVRAGDDLRLVVRDVSAERVLLGMSEPTQTQPPTLPPPPVALPGGGAVRVTERDPEPQGHSAPGMHTVSLRYDAPALGAVDLRFELSPGALQVAVTVAPGDPLDGAQAGAQALRDALADAVGRPVSVTVNARREPVDIYA